MDVADRRDPTAGTSGPTPASRSDDEPSPSDRVRVLVCTRGEILEIDDPAEAHKALADPDARAWIDLVDPSPERVERIGHKLELHPLIVEDILERNQRAKVEEIDGDLHIVIFDLRFDGEVKLTEVDIVLGERFLLTSHDAAFEPLALAQLRGGAAPLLARGHDYLLYAMLDGIVDGYFPVLDELSEDLDSLEDAVIETPTSWTLQRLFTLKRELMALRRATSPAREVLNQLTNRESDRIRPEHILYFRDVYDHLIRVADEVDNDRELVAGTLDVYLSTVNNNLSAIMKRLTGVTVILAGIGAVAGIFGMSEAGAVFDGAEHPGFWMVSVVIVVLAAVTAVVLRRIDWI
jgi:magnesium transporter